MEKKHIKDEEGKRQPRDREKGAEGLLLTFSGGRVCAVLLSDGLTACEPSAFVSMVN